MISSTCVNKSNIILFLGYQVKKKISQTFDQQGTIQGL